MQISLEFDRNESVWRFLSFADNTEKREDRFINALVAFLEVHKGFKGTATELAMGLAEYDHSLDIKPNSMTRMLKGQALILEKRHDILFTTTRKNSSRLIQFSIKMER